MGRSSSCLFRTLHFVPLAFAVATIPGAHARAVPRVSHGKAEARFAEPFDRASSVLPGRLQNRQGPAIGREGQGPGGSENSGGVSVMVRRQRFAAQDDWSVAPDGRVGVVRTGDYHAEWWNGTTKINGPAVRSRRCR